LTATDVVNAIREQNVQVAAGVIGASPTQGDVPMQFSVNAQGRLQDEVEFGNIILKSSPDGAVTRLSDVAGHRAIGRRLQDPDRSTASSRVNALGNRTVQSAAAVGGAPASPADGPMNFPANRQGGQQDDEESGNVIGEASPAGAVTRQTDVAGHRAIGRRLQD